MRLSEFAAKRIVNLYDGDILGTVGESDLLVDPVNGGISAIILPPPRGFSAFSGSRRQVTIPWETVRKVGSEVIVIDLEANY